MINIKSTGLLPVYNHVKYLEKYDPEALDEYRNLLKENNSPEVYKSYLDFEKKMDKDNSNKNVEYDHFLCEL